MNRLDGINRLHIQSIFLPFDNTELCSLFEDISSLMCRRGHKLRMDVLLICAIGWLGVGGNKMGRFYKELNGDMH